MAYSFEPVRLDAANGDDEALLLFRDGRLLAVISHLGEGHGAVAGQWFVETVFSTDTFPLHATFRDLTEVEARLAQS
jgi:hypothetical protein